MLVAEYRLSVVEHTAVQLLSLAVSALLADDPRPPVASVNVVGGHRGAGAACQLQRWLTLVNHGTVFYMNEVTTVLLEEAEVRNLNDQVAHLEPGEPYLTVIVDGKAIVRATRGISQTLLQLWRSEPAMMVPDSLGYRPATRQVDLADL